MGGSWGYGGGGQVGSSWGIWRGRAEAIIQRGRVYGFKA